VKTSEKIIEYIQEKGEASASELVDYLELSERAIFKQLRNLLDSGDLIKKGIPPKVYYMVVSNQNVAMKEEIGIHDSPIEYLIIDEQLKHFIGQNFFQITPIGLVEEGLDGFVKWCRKRSLPVSKTASEYRSTLLRYQRHFNKAGLIDGMGKFKSTFNEIFLDEVYYLDFYSVERFGKTKLGQKLLYAKQSQNKQLTKELSIESAPKIKTLIKNKRIDAVGFIPPTVKREVQFIKEFEKGLNLKLPIVRIVKIRTKIAVPQKTLSKLDDRIENAKATIVADDRRSFTNVLLIDDAVGSGATLNETAKGIKQKGISKKVIGIAITGSFKGFDVISEV